MTETEPGGTFTGHVDFVNVTGFWGSVVDAGVDGVLLVGEPLDPELEQPASSTATTVSDPSMRILM